jgi:predicted alpha/beta-fold hydrolase
MKKGLPAILQQLKNRPFIPARFCKSPNMQTLAYLITPYFKDPGWHLERTFIDVSHQSKIALDCCFQADAKNHPTILAVSGINGSSRSKYMRSLGNKAFHLGFNVILFNFRNMGDSERFSKTLYHAGLSEDIKRTLEELRRWGLRETYISALSLGGNTSLKLAGELGRDAENYMRGLAVISSLTDAPNSWQMLEKQPVHTRLIVKGLKDVIKKRAKIDPPGTWDVSKLRRIKTLREWDNVYQVGEKYPWGFTSVDDYYQKASSLPLIARIQIPTLVIHARDDYILPVSPFLGSEFTHNPHITMLITEHGGHGCFIGKRKISGDLDRHWAQNRVLEFFQFLHENTYG